VAEPAEPERCSSKGLQRAKERAPRSPDFPVFRSPDNHLTLKRTAMVSKY
jgi:hypothetical protein